MANFVFIAEMASFQNGDSPFYIKRISLTPVHSGQLVSFTYAIDFFLEHSDSAFHTFATWNIHGITLDEPGIPYDLSGDTILTALKHHIFSSPRESSTNLLHRSHWSLKDRMRFAYWKN